ncbi:MAG: methyltransferase domain-containing protein [Anaerolineales bacterium]|nr:methyltransferase domain-containing protein [Anaerolineales bacterium]
MNTTDLFADALWRFYETGRADLRIERDDGYCGREDVSWYFTAARDFPVHEKRALKFARGRVLDLGCGAGRHALYLQRHGLRVTALDLSPRIVELARHRGVHDARVANACARLPFRDGEFDTAILFGNNLGIGGTERKLRALLRELYRVTSPRGCILATTRQPSTTNPLHRAYLQKNIARGRAPGQLRLRLVFNGKRGAWFDLLLLAPTDLLRIAAKEKWELARVFPLENFEEGYAVVLERMRDEGRRQK